jgi:hypothetical protein
MLKLFIDVLRFFSPHNHNGVATTKPIGYKLVLNEFGIKLFNQIKQRFNPKRIHQFCRKRGFSLFEYAYKEPIFNV